jgi:murein L,D-transpeptidase YafK
LDYKKRTSRFYKSIHVGYPRPDQRARSAAMGVDPGDEILVHGPELGADGRPGEALGSTEGCVALSAADMDALWELVEPGIPIVIDPR